MTRFLDLLTAHEASKTYLVSASDADRLKLPVFAQKAPASEAPCPRPDPFRLMALEIRRIQQRGIRQSALLISLKVALRSGLTLSELKTRHRKDRLVKPRYRAFYGIRRGTDKSLPTIARSFNLDHTTILYGIRQHEKRLKGQVV